MLNLKKSAIPLSAIFVAILCAACTPDRAPEIESPVYSDGKTMSFDDIRALAKKGDALIFEDFTAYKGMNVSSNTNRYTMVYPVAGSYRLIVDSASSGKPQSTALENIWEDSGSGIDIRHGDLDEFLSKWPIDMLVKDGAASPLGVTVTLKNLTDAEYIYGDDYAVQRKTDDGWTAVEPINGELASNAIGYPLQALESAEITVNWEWAYGKLPAGDYRITKTAALVRHPGDYDNFTLFAAFTITE
ncbi:MAG: hypothetical protein LBI99_07380 [Propionibacteriaceae bacterium]|jgi:hypothetical protein|nr:hypothetical protein [Propionibacteriaceae bacterium]